jgi:hypothetical protein
MLHKLLLLRENRIKGEFPRFHLSDMLNEVGHGVEPWEEENERQEMERERKERERMERERKEREAKEQAAKPKPVVRDSNLTRDPYDSHATIDSWVNFPGTHR